MPLVTGMDECLIYGLADPRTGQIRYVGKSSSGLKRPQAHAKPSELKGRTHKVRWIRELQAEGLTYGVQVLSVCEPDDLDDAEIFCIAYGRHQGWPLTNATDGGDGQSRGYVPSPEACAKLSAAGRGRSFSAETRAKISAANRGRHSVSAETRAKMSAAKLGTPLSPEHRAKLSAVRKGKPRSAETRAKISATKKGKPRAPRAYAGVMTGLPRLKSGD